MSFLSRLFGRNRTAEPAEPAAPAATVDHKGYTVRAEPYPAGSQYQTAGTVLKEVDGVLREHRFVRADRFASRDEAAAFSLQKGRQIVDEQGDGLFR